jgi:uncharacterized membrane protein YedE/YeeE
MNQSPTHSQDQGQNQSQNQSQTLIFHLISCLTGFLFATGLGISGMVDPAKVIGFLDITSLDRWNPALLWVMCGAIGVFGISQVAGRKLTKPFAAPNWNHIPARGASIPTPVIIGNILFGAGWGLAGYCPGPAFVSLATLSKEPIIFVLSMILGFLVFEIGASKRPSKS